MTPEEVMRLVEETKGGPELSSENKKKISLMFDGVEEIVGLEHIISILMVRNHMAMMMLSEHISG